LAWTDQDLARRKGGKAPVVIDMHMGEDDALPVGRSDAERAKLRPGFLIRFDVEPHREPEIGMPAREAFEAGGGARIDKDHAGAMLDRISVDRQPVRPFRVDQRGEPTRKAVTLADDLARLDPHPARLDRINAHGKSPRMRDDDANGRFGRDGYRRTGSDI